MDVILGWFGGISIVAGAIIAVQKLIMPPIRRWWDARQATKMQGERIAKLEEVLRELKEAVKAGAELDEKYEEDSIALKELIKEAEGFRPALRALQAANLAMMYDKLHHLITKAVERGYTTFDEFDVIHNLHRAYLENDGNGVMAKWMEVYGGLEKRAS